jgi:hypothetical protein
MVAKRNSLGAGSPQRRSSSGWTVEYYVTANGTAPVLEWVKKLPEPKRVAWLAFVEFALVPQGKDIEQSGYVKPLGQGLFELRIDHDAVELAQVFGADLTAYPDLGGSAGAGILLRVFCTFYGNRVVLLLSGLDKGASPKAQPRAIQAARKLLIEWRAEQAVAKRKAPRR